VQMVGGNRLRWRAAERASLTVRAQEARS